VKLSKRELQRTLDALAAANAKTFALRDKIAAHCQEVYGVDPSEIDNDAFIDSCDGGCGATQGMTAEAFDLSMREAMKMAGLKEP
jgi:hypothetical protein